MLKLINHGRNSQTNSITWYLTSPWKIGRVPVSRQAERRVDRACTSAQLGCRCMQSTVKAGGVPKRLWWMKMELSKASLSSTYNFMLNMNEGDANRSSEIFIGVSLPFQMFICCLETTGACKSALKWYISPCLFIDGVNWILRKGLQGEKEIFARWSILLKVKPLIAV